LAIAISPVLCHMAEDIWQYLPYETGHQSVFQAGWVKLDPQWSQPALTTTWHQIRELRDGVNKVLEQARTHKAIGSSLESKVLLVVPDETMQAQLSRFSSSVNSVDELRYFFLASQVELVSTLTGADFQGASKDIQIGVSQADGHKCDRCWNYAETVGTHSDHDILCDRCVGALAGEF
jgi:isoleucyl-tRNA synthetase